QVEGRGDRVGQAGSDGRGPHGRGARARDPAAVRAGRVAGKPRGRPRPPSRGGAGEGAGVTASPTNRTIDAVWRIESPRLIAGLARMVGDVGLAEDLAQDALVVALERWPADGVPDNPGAWLMTTAKRRAIDLLRRDKLLDRKHEQLGHELE